MKHGDADIQHQLESTVPPIDLNGLSIFRVAVRKFEKQAGAQQVPCLLEG